MSFPLRAKFDYVTRTLAGAEGVPYDANPDPDAVFSELSERDVPDAPAPPVPTGLLPGPSAPPPAVIDTTDHGRHVRGTEVIEGGVRYR